MAATEVENLFYIEEGMDRYYFELLKVNSKIRVETHNMEIAGYFNKISNVCTSDILKQFEKNKCIGHWFKEEMAPSCINFFI